MNPPNMSNTARHNVLDTPELSEAIISFLPNRDILSKAQRVSRTWKAAIAQSPTVQTKLWLRSQAIEAAVPIPPLPDQEPETRPSRTGKSKLPVYPNKNAHSWLFFGGDRLKTSSKRTLDGRKISEHNSPVYHVMFLRGLRHILDRPQPSWLPMYLTEPPITVARVCVSPFTPPPQPFAGTTLRSPDQTMVTISVHNENGLTFETVLAAAKQVCEELSLLGHYPEIRNGIVDFTEKW